MPVTQDVPIKPSVDPSAVPVAAANIGGEYHQRMMEAKLTFASSNGTPITTATDTLAVAHPGTAKHLQVWRLHISNKGSNSVVVSFKEDTTGPLLFETNLPTDGVLSIKLNGDWDLAEDKPLYIHTDAAGSVYWTIGYVTPDV